MTNNPPMISISKGGWALAAFIAGLLAGAAMPTEINTAKREAMSLLSTAITAAGQGSQNLGEAVAE